MDKKDIQKHKGRLSIINYTRKDNMSNIITGEIMAVTNAHSIIAVNKQNLEIFIRNTSIKSIVSDKIEMKIFKE